jgi:hypothetical protein
MIWLEIRLEASNLISKIKADTNLVDIDQYILATGYEWAPNPHKSTIDLLTVYAANLRNTSGNGPSIKAFSLMIRAAIIEQGVIEENRLIRPLEVSSFSKACADYLRSEKATPLAEDTQTDYYRDLMVLSAGSERSKALVNGLIKSITGFSKVLCTLYDGSAQRFHEDIDGEYDASKSTSFVVNAYKKIMHLNGVGGVALAMNFFKDSQAPSKRGTALSELVNTKVGWFVKPDMHILRFMLAATGRAESADLLDEDLVHLSQDKAAKIYANYNPRKSWSSALYNFDSGQPTNKVGQWRCVEDVHRFAKYLKISPLEIDRILFMVGSGNFGEGIRDSSSQKARYLRLLPLIRKAAGINSTEFDSKINPPNIRVSLRRNSCVQKISASSLGEVVFKKLNLGEWGSKVKLVKILKKRVSNDQDLFDAQNLISLLRRQKASKPLKSNQRKKRNRKVSKAIAESCHLGITMQMKCIRDMLI